MSGSVLSLFIPSRHAIFYDRGEPIGCFCPIPSPMALAFARSRAARHSQVPHHPLPMGRDLRGFTSSLALRPVELLASLADLTGSYFLPANGDSYSRAFRGSVTLPVVGYNCGGYWAISTGGTFTHWNVS